MKSICIGSILVPRRVSNVFPASCCCGRQKCHLPPRPLPFWQPFTRARIRQCIVFASKMSPTPWAGHRCLLTTAVGKRAETWRKCVGICPIKRIRKSSHRPQAPRPGSSRRVNLCFTDLHRDITLEFPAIGTERSGRGQQHDIDRRVEDAPRRRLREGGDEDKQE